MTAAQRRLVTDRPYDPNQAIGDIALYNEDGTPQKIPAALIDGTPTSIFIPATAFVRAENTLPSGGEGDPILNPTTEASSMLGVPVWNIDGNSDSATLIAVAHVPTGLQQFTATFIGAPGGGPGDAHLSLWIAPIPAFPGAPSYSPAWADLDDFPISTPVAFNIITTSDTIERPNSGAIYIRLDRNQNDEGDTLTDLLFVGVRLDPAASE